MNSITGRKASGPTILRFSIGIAKRIIKSQARAIFCYGYRRLDMQKILYMFVNYEIAKTNQIVNPLNH